MSEGAASCLEYKCTIIFIILVVIIIVIIIIPLFCFWGYLDILILILISIIVYPYCGRQEIRMPSSPDHCDILTIPIIILIPIIVYPYCDCEEIWANLWSLQYFFFFSFFLVLRYIESFLIIFNHFWSLCSSLSLFILTVIVRRSGPISDCNSSHLSRSSSSSSLGLEWIRPKVDLQPGRRRKSSF